MKLFRSLCLAVALMFTAAFGVAACTTLGTVIGNQSVATYDEKALLSAELGYSFLLDGVGVGLASGLITQERAPAVGAALKKANDAISAARKAYHDGERADAAIASRNAVVAVSEIAALLTEYGVLKTSPTATPGPAPGNVRPLADGVSPDDTAGPHRDLRRDEA